MTWVTAAIIYGVGCAFFLPFHFAVDRHFPRNDLLVSVAVNDGAGFFLFLIWPFVVVYMLFCLMFWIPTATVKGIAGWWEKKNAPKAIPSIPSYPQDKR